MNFTYKELTTESEVKELIEWHNANSKYVFLDVETTGLDLFTDSITDIVLNDKEKFTAVIFNQEYTGLLSTLAVPVIAHNFKFDFNMLYRSGVDLRSTGLHADTMLLDHLIEDNDKHLEGHSLDTIVKRKYNDPYKDIFWSTYKDYSSAPKQAQIEYACKDIIYTEMVYEDLCLELDQAGIPQSLIDHVHKLALSLYDTELNGINLDVNYLNNLSVTISDQMVSNLSDMRTSVDYPCSLIENEDYITQLSERKTDKGKANVKRPQFNFDSNKQLGVLLYDKLKLPEQINRKTRSRTVDDKALENLETKHPFISKIRQHRGLQKVFTSFIEGSLDKMHNGRVYPSFNINGAVTGRISSSEPNMQQLPKDGGIRGIYVPNQGRSFLSCDYAQLEVALAAHFSRDENLLKIIYEGASQHDITAAGLSIPRGLAKNINFAMQYGAGVKKIQFLLDCSMPEAELALNKYWETYAGLYRFIKTCHKCVDDGIPLINPFGRQRRFKTTFKDKWERESAYRQAANSLIQGTGADITHEAFYITKQDLRQKQLGIAYFPIHDEILVEVDNSACFAYRSTLISIMQAVGERIALTVPLKAECSLPTERWMKG